MSHWKIVKLGEVATFKTGKLNSNAAEKNGKYPFFTCAPEPLKINSYSFDQQAILLAGNNAEGNFHIKYYEGKFDVYQRTYVFSARPSFHLKFLYYSIKLCLEKFKRISVGTATKFLTAKILNGFTIPCPPLDTQKKIAAVLSALDDKIELNNAINKNLEEQAQAIFDNCFYDKWNNENFSVSSLDKIAEYLNGLAMQKFRPKENETGLPVLKIKELRQRFCDKESDRCSEKIKPEFIIKDGDVIFSWSGTLLIDFWCGGLCGLNQHLFKVTSKNYGKWFYYLWTKYHMKKFIKMANDMATTMGHIKRKALIDSKVLIPDRESYLQLEKILQPICDKMITIRLENQKLGELRDALLPRLMSGEIDVSTVEV